MYASPFCCTTHQFIPTEFQKPKRLLSSELVKETLSRKLDKTIMGKPIEHKLRRSDTSMPMMALSATMKEFWSN